MLMSESNNIRPCLNFIQAKEMVINIVRKRCTTMKETLNRKPIDTTKNTINFLNTLSEKELRTIGIKDIITVITWDRKVVGKNQHVESVQEKIDIMLHQIKTFKASCPCFRKDYIPFGKKMENLCLKMSIKHC